MIKLKNKTIPMIILVCVCCVIMAMIETVVEPAYLIKSALKVVFFLAVPLVFMKLIDEKVFDSFALDKKSILKLLGLGAGIYALIIGAYFLTKGIFDYSDLVNSLTADQKVSPGSFIWVALYISFGNSLLEEFMFRLIAFIVLSRHAPKPVAYIFSSVAFAVYHIAMIGKSFPLPLFLLSLVGLAAGGLIFDFVDFKNKNIYNSWIIHMFADFAIMTIWFLNIG